MRSLGWSGTWDIGFSLTRFSFQVTYVTDADTNAERDCIVLELRRSRVIGEVTSYESGQHPPIEPVNHYVIDWAVSVAESHGASGLRISVCILVLQPTPPSRPDRRRTPRRASADCRTTNAGLISTGPGIWSTDYCRCPPTAEATTVD